jgi:hypothetical protein
MSRKTKTTVLWPRIEDRHGLTGLAYAVREAAFHDNLVEDYDLTLIRPNFLTSEAPIRLIVEIRGSVNARDFVNAVIARRMGLR